MQGELQDKKNAILRAALELIAEQGFHGTPISQIAQKANVNVGSIYYYFTNKDDLVNTLYINNKARLAQYAFQNYSRSAPVYEGFKQLLRNIVHYFVENPAELSFMEQFENSPLITSSTHEEYMRIGKPFEDLFERAKEQNLIKELPPVILQTLFTGAIVSLTKLYIKSEVKLEESSLSSSIDAILDMIKK